MNLFPYREETDQELIQAAARAYEEAPPEHNPGISKFGWAVARRNAAMRGDPPPSGNTGAA
jgi:hypothetical protein